MDSGIHEIASAVTPLVRLHHHIPYRGSDSENEGYHGEGYHERRNDYRGWDNDRHRSRSGRSEPIIGTKIHKIHHSSLVKFDPEQGATSKYCDNLRQFAHLFGEQSVLAVVPATLQERALDWFGSSMPRHALDSLEDWIAALQDEFRVNTAKT